MIVETNRVEYGEVAVANHEVEDEQIVKPLRKVRAATEEDEQRPRTRN